MEPDNPNCEEEKETESTETDDELEAGEDLQLGVPIDSLEQPEPFETTVSISGESANIDIVDEPGESQETEVQPETSTQTNESALKMIKDTEANGASAPNGRDGLEDPDNNLQKSPAHQDQLPDEISHNLGAIYRKLDFLHQEFEGKLKYDEHKNRIIDNLHEELQTYKEDLAKKNLQSIMLDVIKIIDDIRKITKYYHNKMIDEIDVPKLLKIIDTIPSDLEDIFSYQGIQSFYCEGDVFDPRRQRIIEKIETVEQLKDKSVAERLRPGYEWDGKVIRPEMISVWVFKKNSVDG